MRRRRLRQPDRGAGQTAAPSQTAAPNQAVCSSVADVQQAAGALRALDPANTTVTQVQAAFTDLQSATSGLASAASAASSADQEALSSAVDGLRSAAQSAAESVAAGESPQKALAAVGAAAVPVEQAADALGPDCPGTGGTTTGVTSQAPADERVGGGLSAGGGRVRGSSTAPRSQSKAAGGLIEAGDELGARAMPAVVGALGGQATTTAASPGSAQRTTRTDARGPAWASSSRRPSAAASTCVPRLRAAETTVLPPLSADMMPISPARLATATPAPAATTPLAVSSRDGAIEKEPSALPLIRKAATPPF